MSTFIKINHCLYAFLLCPSFFAWGQIGDLDSEIAVFKIEQLAAIRHQNDRISAAHAAADEVATQIGVRCEQDNALQKAIGKEFCSVHLCKISEGQSNTPSNLKVSVEARTNFNQWSVHVGFEWIGSNTIGNSAFVCKPPSELKLVKDTYMDVLTALMAQPLS